MKKTNKKTRMTTAKANKVADEMIQKISEIKVGNYIPGSNVWYYVSAHLNGDVITGCESSQMLSRADLNKTCWTWWASPQAEYDMEYPDDADDDDKEDMKDFVLDAYTSNILHDELSSIRDEVMMFLTKGE